MSIGVHRVWVKNQDFPGLAMSRSLGDKLAHTVGVSAEPGKNIWIEEYRCVSH